jgi:Zn-dependent protease with chaperone function
MNVSGFLGSYPGMYMAQTFCHSIIAFVIIDRAMYFWNITNPVIRQRFQMMVVLLPVLSFPLYQAINPDRGSISFRLQSLFDVNRWLNLELWGTVPLWPFFFAITGITTLLFIFQEMLPILLHTLESKRSKLEIERPGDDSVVNRAVEQLPVEKPDIFLLDDDDFVLFSTTGRNAAVFLSNGVTKALNVDQIQAAVLHEIAHIMRNKKPLLLIVFFFRMLMFFNPLALLEFRKLVQEEEKICDDIAVAITKKPHALVEVLEKLYQKTGGIRALQRGSLSEMKNYAEDYSHNVHIESRIVRLEQEAASETDGEWYKLICAVAAIMGINYFVV